MRKASISARAAVPLWGTNMNRKKTGKKFSSYVIWFLKSGLYAMPLLLGLDIFTKLFCITHFYSFKTGACTKIITVIPGFFFIRTTTNTGAAWSALAGHTVLLSIISLLASVGMIVVLALKYKKMSGWFKAAMYLMIPGAVGNLIDRSFSYLAPNSLYQDGVIDFLSFRFGSYDFPIFNLADSYLTISVIILLIAFIISDAKEKNRHKKILDRISKEEEEERKNRIEENGGDEAGGDKQNDESGPSQGDD